MQNICVISNRTDDGSEDPRGQGFKGSSEILKK